jgi:methyl-accepting chemotaxis protein
MKISTRLSAACCLLIFLTLFATIGLIGWRLSGELSRRAEMALESNLRLARELLAAQGDGFRVEGDKLLVGNHVLNGDFDTVDKVNRIAGGSATLFLGDTRIATTIRAADGQRAIGTHLAAGPVYDTVLREHRPWHGETQILGESYLTWYDPITDASGQVVGILFVGQKRADFLASLQDLFVDSALIGLVAVCAGGALMLIAVRRTLRPLDRIRDAIRRLGDGDRAVEIPDIGRRDEIGVIADAVLAFREALTQADALGARQAAAEAEKAAQKEETMTLVRHFATEITSVVQSVSDASDRLRDTSRTLQTKAEGASDQTATASRSASEAHDGVASMAAAAEQLSASIDEIKRQIATADAVAAQAVTEADSTQALVEGLSLAATRIDDVVRLINGIASQTNLLALNATIEAARAGEAGKGFAVVASEVKILANQTAQATGDIQQHIQEIQAETGKAVAAIRLIARTVAEISGITGSVARGMAEQGDATSEIARTVQRVAALSAALSSTIAGVTEAAADTGASSAEMLTASVDLAAQSGRLNEQVGAFVAALSRG